MDFKAAAIVLWYQEGNRNKFRDADETTREFYLDRAHEIVVAALKYHAKEDNDDA